MRNIRVGVTAAVAVAILVLTGCGAAEPAGTALEQPPAEIVGTPSPNESESPPSEGPSEAEQITDHYCGLLNASDEVKATVDASGGDSSSLVVLDDGTFTSDDGDPVRSCVLSGPAMTIGSCIAGTQGGEIAVYAIPATGITAFVVAADDPGGLRESIHVNDAYAFIAAHTLAYENAATSEWYWESVADHTLYSEFIGAAWTAVNDRLLIHVSPLSGDGAISYNDGSLCAARRDYMVELGGAARAALQDGT